jgi:hypothetical protein
MTPPLEQGGRKGSDEAAAFRPVTVAQGLPSSPLFALLFLLCDAVAATTRKAGIAACSEPRPGATETPVHYNFSKQLFHNAH